MENGERLRDYLSYEIKEEQLSSLFYALSFMLENLHQKGYEVTELNSDTIQIENQIPTFTQIARIDIQKNLKEENILDLTKLMLGSYITISVGFSDYTKLSLSFLQENFNEMENIVPSSIDKMYFREVIVNGKREYYHHFYERKAVELEPLGNSSSHSNARTKSKVLPNGVGKMYMLSDDSQDKMGAFINVIFYPTLLLVLTIVLVISYHLYLFLEG